tara:strand:+ start:3022 stop:3774 length:753 start_codon:yes stop_codon:yes gene_type:complete
MSKYSETEYDLFSRLFILNEFSEKKLDILSKQNISIVGIGGIGCPLSQYLISSGIKNLLLVDGDIIEKNNLNRQILFNNDDINKKKVIVAKKKLSKINPNSNINIFEKNIDSKNIDILSNSKIIVDATDDWKTSRLLNEFCIRNSINFIFSSVVKHDVQTVLFDNKSKGNHLCLNCIFPNKNDIDLPRCETAGISGISAGIAGLITAQKIINFTLSLREETGLLTISDVKQLNIDNIVVKGNHNCYLKSF